MSTSSTHGNMTCKDLIVENQITFQGTTNDGNTVTLTCPEPGTGAFNLNLPAITQNETLMHENTAVGKISAGTVPSTNSSTGTTGEIAFSSTHLYICTATNTWRRVTLSSWGS